MIKIICIVDSAALPMVYAKLLENEIECLYTETDRTSGEIDFYFDDEVDEDTARNLINEAAREYQLSLIEGTVFPDSPLLGQQFFRTDEKKKYRYNGVDWELMSAADLSSLEGDLDGVADGATYGKVLITQLASGQIIFQTEDKDGLNVADYVGKIVFDISEGVHYTSDGTDWLVVNLSAPDVWKDEKVKVRSLTHNPISRAWYGPGIDGVVTIDTDTDLGDDACKQYKALTVDEGFTLSLNSPAFIFVSQELVLNGTIAVKPQKAGGIGGKVQQGAVQSGGNGANGGGIVYVYAQKITGAGKITANGENGQDGITQTGNSTPVGPVAATAGEGCQVLETNYSGAGAGGLGGTSSESGAAGGTKGTKGANIPQSIYRKWYVECLSDYGLHSVSANRIALGGGGGGGGPGGQAPLSGNTSVGGGGGGAGGSLIGAGGDGGAGQAGGTPVQGPVGGGGGGGGSAGGVIFLVSEDCMDTIQLESNGGNGGNGGNGYLSGAGGGGGGGPGAGGYVFTLTNIKPTTITITAGTAGTAGTGGTGGAAGGSGEEGEKKDYPTDTFRETPQYITCPCCGGRRLMAACGTCGYGIGTGGFCWSKQKCSSCGSWYLITTGWTCTTCNGAGVVPRG